MLIYTSEYGLKLWLVILIKHVFSSLLKNQRTNGHVNAHLRSAVYMNVIENSPSIGADEALGPFFFLQNNQYTVHTSFSLQMTF